MARAAKATAGYIIIVVLLLVGLVIGLTSGAIRFEVPTRVVGPPLCAGLDSTGRKFEAKTRDAGFTAITEANSGRGIVYRRAANTDSDFDVIGRLLPANCQVGFVGFCIGEALPDLSSPNAPLDQQWFILPDKQGYVHGGVVQELPPGTIDKAPQQCEGGRPESVGLQAAGPLPKTLIATTRVEMRAPNAVTVGAAVYAKRSDGSTGWTPIAMDRDREDGFLLVLDPKGLPTQSDATLLITVCLAGNVPGRKRLESKVSIGAEQTAQGASTQGDSRQGGSVACKGVAGGS